MTTKAIVTVIVIVLSAMFAGNSVVAQSGAMAGVGGDVPDWLKVGMVGVGLLAGPTISVWYLWYDTCKVKPRLERIHREQIERILEAHAKQVHEIEERHAAHWTLSTTNARNDLRDMTVTHKESLDKLIEGLDRLADALGHAECKFDPGAHHGQRPAG